MAERFHNITQDEMEGVLLPMGFQQMTLPQTVELVYGKIVRIEGKVLSLRIYTGINPNGQSRAKGSDAIRVQLYWKYNDQPKLVGKSQKCLRVKTWAKNIVKAIDKVQDEFVLCPACNAPLVERNGRNGAFMGCVTWHDTGCLGKPGQSPKPQPKPSTPARTTERKPVTPQQRTNSPRKNRFRIEKPSAEQSEVIRLFEEETVCIVAESRAGGGKTTLLSDLASRRKSGERMVYLAFGRRNAKDGKRKLPSEVPSRTTHSFLVQNLREQKLVAGDPDPSKNLVIMDDVYPHLNNDDRKRVRRATFRLIGLAKNFACKPDDKVAIREVMDSYTFDLQSEGEYETVVDLVSEVLKLSLPKAKYGNLHTFNDWLWFTAVLQVPLPKLGCALADEVQDFNACQIDMLRRLEADGCRIVAVGDPFQAVYRFRGADCDAFEKIEAMLEASKRGSKKVLLPTNYRCSKAVIRHTVEHTIVKDIVAHDDAPEGLVDEGLCYGEILDLLEQEYSQKPAA